MRRLVLIAFLLLVAVPCSALANGQVFVDYDEGLAVGNYVLLYQVTHKPGYLARAEQIAKLSARGFDFRLSRFGSQLEHSLYFRNLKALQVVAPHAEYARSINRYESRLPRLPWGRRLPNGLTRAYLDPPSDSYIYLWPFSQVVAHELEHPRRSVRDIVTPLRFYWDQLDQAYAPVPGSEPRRVYFDDNVWVGLDYARAYELRHDRDMLFNAERVMRFLYRGWLPGEAWLQAGPSDPQSITMGSTGGAEQLALRLYQATHAAAYLRWALRAQAWLDAHMRARNGLYYDAIELWQGRAHAPRKHHGPYGPYDNHKNELVYR